MHMKATAVDGKMVLELDHEAANRLFGFATLGMLMMKVPEAVIVAGIEGGPAVVHSISTAATLAFYRPSISHDENKKAENAAIDALAEGLVQPSDVMFELWPKPYSFTSHADA